MEITKFVLMCLWGIGLILFYIWIIPRLIKDWKDGR